VRINIPVSLIFAIMATFSMTVLGGIWPVSWCWVQVNDTESASLVQHVSQGGPRGTRD
jgi:hypothetical protein